MQERSQNAIEAAEALVGLLAEKLAPLEAVMNLLRNGLRMHETADRR